MEPVMPINIKDTIFLGAIISMMTGCFSSKKEGADNLDITPPTHATEEKKLSYEDLTSNDKKAFPSEAVTNWQMFFKGPPSVGERSQLEQKLQKWTDNDTVTGLLAKGRNETALGHYAAAEISYRKALRLDTNNHDALLELASMYLKKGDIVTSFDLLAQVREVTTTSEKITQTFVFKYRYILAMAYIARGDRDKGHAILSDLIGEVKTFAPAYTALASSYIEMGRLSVAEFVMKRATDRIKDSPAVFNLMGYIYQRDRQLEAARRWYDKALALNPNYAPALVNRGNLYAQQYELDQAEKDLLSALAADPLSSDAMVSLGIVQKRKGNLAGAKVSLTKAVDLDPGNAYARFNLGVLLANDLKQPTEAMRLFNEVLQTSNASQELSNLARNYLADLQRDQISEK